LGYQNRVFDWEHHQNWLPIGSGWVWLGLVGPDSDWFGRSQLIGLIGPDRAWSGLIGPDRENHQNWAWFW
jgi:hypothetical protein